MRTQCILMYIRMRDGPCGVWRGRAVATPTVIGTINNRYRIIHCAVRGYESREPMRFLFNIHAFLACASGNSRTVAAVFIACTWCWLFDSFTLKLSVYIVLSNFCATVEVVRGSRRNRKLWRHYRTALLSNSANCPEPSTTEIGLVLDLFVEYKSCMSCHPFSVMFKHNPIDVAMT